MLLVDKGHFEIQQSIFQLKGINHIELYVGNVFQAAHFYRTVFGFRPIASLGLKAQVRDHVSIAMQQGQAFLVLTASLCADSPIAQHVRQHGDGVKVIALWVDDATKSYEETVKRGAKPFRGPKSWVSTQPTWTEWEVRSRTPKPPPRAAHKPRRPGRG